MIHLLRIKPLPRAQEFPFALLSDSDRIVGKQYGVARPASDHFAEFPRRLSFLIDPDGLIREVYDVADVASHAEQVLADIERFVADPE